MKRLVVLLAFASLPPAGQASRSPARVAVTVRDPAATPAALLSRPPGQMLPTLGDVRAISAHDGDAWVATAGGLVRVSLRDRTTAYYGLAAGLDSLDVRGVRHASGALLVDTATGRCALGEGRFLCEPARGPAPHVDAAPPNRLAGERARVSAGDGEVVARGDGTVAHATARGRVTTISLGASAPPSFLTSVATFRGEVLAGTFRDGLFRARRDGGPIAGFAAVGTAPFRMVNALASVRDASDGVERLFVAAHEGLFVSRDGAAFTAVPAIGARSLTGVTAHDGLLWVSSTEALYSMGTDGRGRVRSAMLRPAGTRSIQSMTAGGSGVIWLATEDRGMVRVEAGRADAFDALRGLPSSWMVSARADGSGGVVAATLRHGAVRLAADGTPTTTVVSANPWTLSTVRWGGATCVGSQGGVRCDDGGGRPVGLVGLPASAAHGLFVVDDALWVSTDGGLAIYPPDAIRLAAEAPGAERAQNTALALSVPM